MIRVGVDAWNLPYDRRGIGRYVRALVTALRDEHASEIALTLVVPEWSVWTVAPRYRRELPGRALPVVSRRAARRGFDLLWFPFNGPSWDDFTGVPSQRCTTRRTSFCRASTTRRARRSGAPQCAARRS